MIKVKCMENVHIFLFILSMILSLFLFYEHFLKFFKDIIFYKKQSSKYEIYNIFDNDYNSMIFKKTKGGNILKKSMQNMHPIDLNQVDQRLNFETIDSIYELNSEETINQGDKKEEDKRYTHFHQINNKEIDTISNNISRLMTKKVTREEILYFSNFLRNLYDNSSIIKQFNNNIELFYSEICNLMDFCHLNEHFGKFFRNFIFLSSKCEMDIFKNPYSSCTKLLTKTMYEFINWLKDNAQTINKENENVYEILNHPNTWTSYLVNGTNINDILTDTIYDFFSHIKNNMEEYVQNHRPGQFVFFFKWNQEENKPPEIVYEWGEGIRDFLGVFDYQINTSLLMQGNNIKYTKEDVQREKSLYIVQLKEYMEIIKNIFEKTWEIVMGLEENRKNPIISMRAFLFQLQKEIKYLYQNMINEENAIEKIQPIEKIIALSLARHWKKDCVHMETEMTEESIYKMMKNSVNQIPTLILSDIVTMEFSSFLPIDDQGEKVKFLEMVYEKYKDGKISPIILVSDVIGDGSCYFYSSGISRLEFIIKFLQLKIDINDLTKINDGICKILYGIDDVFEDVVKTSLVDHEIKNSNEWGSKIFIEDMNYITQSDIFSTIQYRKKIARSNYFFSIPVRKINDPEHFLSMILFPAITKIEDLNSDDIVAILKTFLRILMDPTNSLIKKQLFSFFHKNYQLMIKIRK